MQSSSTRDLAVGAFVLLGLLAIAYLSVQVGDLASGGPRGLQVIARFDEIGGLSVRAPVVIAGVKVGHVMEIELDTDLRAEVRLDLDPSLVLPVDTSASIRTSGLLGDQFIALEPGGDDQLLGVGDELDFTESALNLEKLIGTLMHDSSIGVDP